MTLNKKNNKLEVTIYLVKLVTNRSIAQANREEATLPPSPK